MGIKLIIISTLLLSSSFAFSFDINDQLDRDLIRDRSRIAIMANTTFQVEPRVSFDMQVVREAMQANIQKKEAKRVSHGDIASTKLQLEGGGEISVNDAVLLLSRALGYQEPIFNSVDLKNKSFYMPSIQGTIEGYVDYLQNQCNCTINVHAASKIIMVF